jgi:uncharacterized glyoxalase superfamily protein PhnB
MKGTAGRPSTTTIARYFKVLSVSEEDQNYVLGIGLAQGMHFSELVEAIQASADFGRTQTNENQEIRDKKIQARLAMRDGDLEKANALGSEIEQFQSRLHFYARKDLEQSAENLAKTLAFRGSIALQTLDFAAAYDLYSQIPKIEGLSREVLEKFIHPIRISYNTKITAQQTIGDARAVLEEMAANGVTPNVVSYSTLLTFLKTEAEVRAVFEEMAANGVTLNVVSYNTLLTFLKTEAEVRAVFDEMAATGIAPDVVSYSTLLTFLKTEAEVRAVFDEMAAKRIAPNIVSYCTLMTKCGDIESGKVVAAEFKELFPNIACRELSSSFISLATNFEDALEAVRHLRSKDHFVGRKEYDKVFSFPIVHMTASELLLVFAEQEFHFDTSLESPINQYRKTHRAEQALQLLLVAPYVGAAGKFYREEYDLCRSYFEAEIETGNDEDNLHYAYGMAAALNGDWEPARSHLGIALERCFPEADKRREHIRSLIGTIPKRSG